MKTALILFWITFNINACHREQTLFVADHYAVNNTEKNLLVKPSQNDDWSQLRCFIQGFDYQEGFTYELKVKMSKNKKNTTCPVSYKLIEVVSKTPSPLINQNLTTNSLIGNWEIVEVGGFINNTGVNAFFKITENSISGNNGCNTFGGKVVIQDESHVKFHQLISTKMFCEETAGLESAVMNAIANTDSYAIKNSELTLFDKEGVVLLKAKLKAEEKTSQTGQQTIEPAFVIKYATSTRGHNSQWEYNGKTIEVEQTRPEVFKKTMAVSEKDQAIIQSLLDKIDLNKLPALTPPSTKHQFDGALVVNLDFIVGDKIYNVPAFDDGNPNAYIKDLVIKLKKLAESK